MKVSKLKYLLGLLGSFELSNVTFAQTNNYSSNAQRPTQIDIYQGQGTTANGTMVNYGGTVVQGLPVQPKRVVNYDLPPTISDNLYSEVKGYKTPDHYTLGGAKRFGNTGRPSGETEADSAAKQLNAMMEEYEVVTAVIRSVIPKEELNSDESGVTNFSPDDDVMEFLPSDEGDN